MAYCWLPAAHCLAQSLHEKARHSPPDAGPPGPRHLAPLSHKILALLQPIAAAISCSPPASRPTDHPPAAPPATHRSPHESSSASPYPPPDQTNPTAP